MRPQRGDGLLTTARAGQHVRVTPATIRKWKQRGWITPDGLDERGNPLYKPETVRVAEMTVRANGLRCSGIDPRVLRVAKAEFAIRERARRDTAA